MRAMRVASKVKKKTFSNINRILLVLFTYTGINGIAQKLEKWHQSSAKRAGMRCKVGKEKKKAGEKIFFFISFLLFSRVKTFVDMKFDSISCSLTWDFFPPLPSISSSSSSACLLCVRRVEKIFRLNKMKTKKEKKKFIYE